MIGGGGGKRQQITCLKTSRREPGATFFTASPENSDGLPDVEKWRTSHDSWLKLQRLQPSDASDINQGTFANSASNSLTTQRDNPSNGLLTEL